MLNIHAIEAAMLKLGLNGTTLAEACAVSKEATSNWLKGESIPRPSKLVKLAEVLKLAVEDLLERGATVPEPRFAYRTKTNRPVTGPAREAAEDLARHLRQLLPYVEERSEFEPPLVREPTVDNARIRNAANAVRASLRLAPSDALTNEHMKGLFHAFGAILVPVLWGLNKEKHENALTVYLPDSKTSWVVFNLGCKQDDYKYWLAHEYGHCLTLHHLNESDGELFAEAFAQHLLFPEEAARECLADMQATTRPKQVVEEFAARHGISTVTVVQGVDRISLQMNGVKTGMADRTFWASWKATRGQVPSVALSIFGTDSPTVEDYVAKSEAAYDTPVFRALAKLQRDDGGRNPAFLSNALKIGLGDAIGLSHALWQRQS